MRPQPGDLLLVDGRASVQFAGGRALLLRVISVSQQPTYDGWVWLTGYILDWSGRATDRREVFVQFAGLRLLTVPLTPPASTPAMTPGRLQADARGRRSSKRAGRNRA